MSVVAKVIPAVVIGGVVYVATRDGDSGGGVTPPTPAPVPGQTVGQSLGERGKRYSAITAGIKSSLGTTTGPVAQDPTRNPTTQPSPGQIDPALQAGLDRAWSEIRKQFANADAVARARAAEYLNKEYKLDPPLNGHEDLDSVASIVGAAIGGSMFGPVGALVGAYLGVTIEQWLSANLSEYWSDLWTTPTVDETIHAMVEYRYETSGRSIPDPSDTRQTGWGVGNRLYAQDAERYLRELYVTDRAQFDVYERQWEHAISMSSAGGASHF